ncbi:hypothetical protein H5410_046172, partial [Solanum commersonii]
VINMVEVTIYFHHGGEWLTSPKPHYDKGWVHNWKGYDPDLISFIDLVKEYTNKLGFVGDEGVRTLTSIISTDYKSIHLFATEDCKLLSCMMDHFYFHQLLMKALAVVKVKVARNITHSLQDYKEIVKGMAFKDMAEAKQFSKIYALAKKYTCVAEGCPFLLLISWDLTTPGVSAKTLLDHRECGTSYDNSLVDYSTIALYFKDKLQSDPKYKVKEMKADLHRVFELNVSEAKCKRAKKEILESLEGSFVDSYNKLEGYATEFRSCNLGSDIVIDLSKEALSNGKRKLLRMYICFKAMKLGFKSGLRPLIGLNDVFYECQQDLIDKYPPKAWCRAYLYTVCKNQAMDNNFTESFNAWILEARYKPIIGMLEDIRVKIMERLAVKEVVVRKWKDDGFSPKSELLFIEYLKISKVCKVSGNGNNGYEDTEGANRHIVNLREKKCTCRTWDLIEIPCPHAIKAMEHKKMIPKKEIDWYYSKEASLAVYKHKVQLVRGEPFLKYDHLHVIEPPELVKLVGRPKLMREREKSEAIKRQGVWNQTRKEKVMTCSNCGEQNHNARGREKGKQPTKKQGKQPAKQGKETGRGKKRQPRRGLVDEDEASDINRTAPQPTRKSQSKYVASSNYFPVAEDDDEEPRLRLRTI